jgi:hypothetical protein
VMASLVTTIRSRYFRASRTVKPKMTDSRATARTGNIFHYYGSAMTAWSRRFFSRWFPACREMGKPGQPGQAPEPAPLLWIPSYTGAYTGIHNLRGSGRRAAAEPEIVPTGTGRRHYRRGPFGIYDP